MKIEGEKKIQMTKAKGEGEKEGEKNEEMNGITSEEKGMIITTTEMIKIDPHNATTQTRKAKENGIESNIKGGIGINFLFSVLFQ